MCVYKSSWMLADTQKYMYTEQLHYVNVCAFVKKKKRGNIPSFTDKK